MAIQSRALNTPTVIGRRSVLTLSGNGPLARLANLTGKEAARWFLDFVCWRRTGSLVIGSPQYPNAASILSHLRLDDRLSLVGTIKGLTPEMEEAFRAARIMIIKRTNGGRDIYAPEELKNSDTMIGASWSELGMPPEPSEAEKRIAYEAYQAWRGVEIFSITRDLDNARQVFKSAFKPKGLELVNPRTSEEIYHAMDLLALLPAGILRSGLLKKVDLSGERVDACRLGRFDKNKKTLTLYNGMYNWDRYFFTRVLLHQLGYAVFELLGESERGEIRSLYQKCGKSKAAHGTSILGDSSGERVCWQTCRDFFAENYMQFIVEGPDMVGQTSNWSLRGELYDFYAKNVPSTNT